MKESLIFKEAKVFWPKKKEEAKSLFLSLYDFWLIVRFGLSNGRMVLCVSNKLRNMVGDLLWVCCSWPRQHSIISLWSCSCSCSCSCEVVFVWYVVYWGGGVENSQTKLRKYGGGSDCVSMLLTSSTFKMVVSIISRVIYVFLWMLMRFW